MRISALIRYPVRYTRISNLDYQASRVRIQCASVHWPVIRRDARAYNAHSVHWPVIRRDARVYNAHPVHWPVIRRGARAHATLLLYALTVVIYYINNNYKVRTRFIALRRLHEDYNKENQSYLLVKILKKKYELVDIVGYFVTNNAGSNDTYIDFIL